MEWSLCQRFHLAPSCNRHHTNTKKPPALAARERFAAESTAPDEWMLCTTAEAGTASVTVRFTFVTVRFEGHACEVATLTASSSSATETTAPVNVTTNGAPGFDAKRRALSDGVMSASGR